MYNIKQHVWCNSWLDCDLKCRTIHFLDHLGKPLEEYLSKIQKVRLIRANERLGLIKARSVDMAEARASTITVLDSQCECYPGK